MSTIIPLSENHQNAAQRKKSIDLMAENNRLRLELNQAVEELEISQQIQGHLEAALIRKTNEMEVTQTSEKLKQCDASLIQATLLNNVENQHLHAVAKEKLGGDLFIAVSNNEVASVVDLIEQFRAEVDYEDDSGSTALTYASKFGSVEAGRILIEHNADVDHVDNSRSTPLIYASKYGHTEFARILIERGADINHRNIYALTPLIYASKYGQTETARLLIESGAVVNLVNIYGSTALMLAAFHGKVDIVKLLLDAGADINHKDRSGWTALISAIQRDYFDVVKVLLEKGADTNIKAESGWTALFYAIKSGDIKIGKALVIDHGAEVNIRSIDRYSYFVATTKKSTEIGKGWTPLMMAVFLGEVDFVEFLLSCGADTYMTSDDGKTAFDLGL